MPLSTSILSNCRFTQQPMFFRRSLMSQDRTNESSQDQSQTVSDHPYFISDSLEIYGHGRRDSKGIQILGKPLRSGNDIPGSRTRLVQ